MISPEFLRRYPFFAGLSYEQVLSLAKVGNTLDVQADHYFFHEGDRLDSYYLIMEGAVALVIDVPALEVEHQLAGQLTGKLETRVVVITAIGPGEVFGWSSLVPPYLATISVKATTPCRVIAFDSHESLEIFEDNCQFGYLMLQKVAQILRDRLRAIRIESLAHNAI